MRYRGSGAPVILGRSEGSIDSLGLSRDSVFWADTLAGAIVSAPKAGGAARVLAEERGLPEKLVTDGTTLCWIERRSESLWTMPASGGVPRRMTEDIAGFAHLLVDARGVWWSNEAAVDGAFRVLGSTHAGEAIVSSPPASAIDALATDGRDLFWERDGAVSRVDAP